jgi:hypothetical protein
MKRGDELDTKKRPARHNKIVAARYWNTNPYAVCIVAVRGDSGRDWAAYIAGASGAEFQEEAEIFAMQHGVKLAQREAEFHFRACLDEGAELHGVPYRR